MDISCQSCGRQKAVLKQVKSKLIPGMNFNSCNECISNRFEPRYIIILATKTPNSNIALTKEIIKEKRYSGETIPAADVM